MSETSDTEQNDGDMMNMFASVWVKVEVDDEDEGATSENPLNSDKKQKIMKTPAQRQKEYRQRKKLKNPKEKKLPKTNAQNQQKYRDNLKKKLLSEPLETILARRKLQAQYAKRYRDNKKKRQQMETLNSNLTRKKGNKDHIPKKKCTEIEPLSSINCKKKKKSQRDISKTLKCNSCDYTTVYKNCLQSHILGHTNTKPYSCDTCNYKTRYPTSLHRHVLIQHEFKKRDEVEKGTPQHKCDQCPYTTHFKWNLNAHRRKHKLEKQFKCELCSYETAYRHNYMKHSKVHNKQEVIFKCDKCPFVTKFEGHITRHLAKIHNEITDKANKCDVCDFSTKTKWRLNIHKQRSKQKDVLKCSYCEFETSFMCESKKHKVSHYNEIYTPKTSDDSFQVTVNVQSLNPEPTPSVNLNQSTHERSNHYTLDPKYEMDWNKIQVTESSSKDRPFQCVMCKYTARFKASVQRHYQRHHTGSQNRPYKCVNCDFSTKTKDQIALHNKRSQSEAQLFCSECDFATFFKCQIVMHQKCHYAHKCSICNYSCKHKYEIQKHYSTIHLGNGIKCRFCDYKASRKESLLCHETIHTGIKPFRCTYCEYMSVRKSLLDNHLRRYHSDIKKDTVVVSDSKIESLKIPVGNVNNPNLIQDLRDENLTLEDILRSQDNFEDVINSTQIDT